MPPKVQLYNEQVSKAKRAKSAKRSGYHVAKSRKPWRMAKRAAVRDSKRAYRSLAIHAAELSSFRDLVKGEYSPPPPTDRRAKTDAERAAEDDDEYDLRHEQVHVGEAAEVVDLVSSDSESSEDDDAALDMSFIEVSSDEEELAPVLKAVPWPSDVEYIARASQPSHIRLPDLGAVDWCGCEDECVVDVCANSASEIYCSTNNCRLGEGCGNRRQEAPGLELRRGRLGYTVFATQAIKRGRIIGEYAGEITDHDFTANERQNEYVMALSLKSTRRRQLYVDAEKKGNITRFVNHCCAPNCHFFELRNRSRVAILLFALDDIPAGTELLTSYGDELWFECDCGVEDCVSKRS